MHALAFLTALLALVALAFGPRAAQVVAAVILIVAAILFIAFWWLIIGGYV